MDGHKKACPEINGQQKTEHSKEGNFVKSIKVKSRKLPDGIYVQGAAQGYPILFTTDTGASKTIISKRVFESMKAADQPKLSGASRLIGACGTEIKELGKGLFLLKLGSVLLEVEAIVADIDDDGLLGIDVLQNGVEGPCDLLLSKGVLLTNKQEVPIMQVGLKTRVRRVASAEHVVIPAQCESAIDVYVERHKSDDFSSESKYLVEPTEHFQEVYPLHMAGTLVDTNRDGSCKVRIVNPFPTAISVRQDAVIGQAIPIESNPRGLAQNENSAEEEDRLSIRRIVIGEKKAVVPETSYATLNKVWDASCAIVPEHPTDVLVKATKNLKSSRLKAKKLGVMPKLEPAYEGPFLVKANYAEIDFLLQLDKSGREKLYHHDKLKPYRGDYPPRWLVRAQKMLKMSQ